MSRQNRHLLMMAICLFLVIPLAALLGSPWAIVLQAAVGGMSFGAHGAMWFHERK